MIVRMTRQQRSRVLRFLEAGNDPRYELAHTWITAEGSVASKHRVDLVMPAAGWAMLLDDLFDFCYDVRGFRSKEASDVLRRACSAIRMAMNARVVHPALSGVAAQGLLSEMIPAWKFPGPDASGKRYSPVPAPMMPFVVLAPTWTERSGAKATKWVEAATPPDRLLYAEAAHLAFQAA